MALITGSFDITCNCGVVHTMNADDFDFETSSEEKSQGRQTQYAAEQEIDCSCGDTIEIVYDVWEYPNGAYNDSDIVVTGGTATGEFDYNFSDWPSPDEPEDN